MKLLLNYKTGLAIIMLTVLFCGCDNDGSTPRAVTRAPAVTVPAGEAPLPMTAIVKDRTMPPRELYEAFRRIEKHGVMVRLIELGSEPIMLVFEIDQTLFEPLLVGVGEGEGLSAHDAITRFDLVLLIGSGFVSELNSLSPVGLLKLNGSVLSELQRHGYTRILGIRKEGIGVVASREYHVGMFDSALQVGPGIIEQGKLDISERDLQRPQYFRTFVASCGERTLVGASLTPMHLYTMGQRLLEYLVEINLSCDEVVNLAGDREVILAMAVEDGSRIVYFGHPNTAKASLLGFRRR